MKPWVEVEALEAAHPADIDDGAKLRAGEALLGAILREFPPHTQRIADLLRVRTRGRFMEEWQSAGERLGVGWRDVALANVSYDLAMIALGCSTMALAGPEGPVLARNLDWWPEAPLVRAALGLRLPWGYSAGWPGFSGVVSGMSRRGFALCLNAVMSAEGAAWTGYPMLLFLRCVLEDAQGFDDALRRVRDTRLASSGLITLVGTENHQRAVVERSPTQAHVRRPEGEGPLFTTNDYRELPEIVPELADALYGTSCSRYEALEQLAGGLSPQAGWSDEALLEVLTHRDVLQSITVQHVILRPRTQAARTFVPRMWL